MTGAVWLVLIAQGVAIVGLLLLYWRTADERDDARLMAQRIPTRVYVTHRGKAYAARAMALAGAADAMVAYTTGEGESVAAAVEGQSAIRMPARPMPAADRAVLAAMAAKPEAICTPEPLIASYAGTTLGANTSRVVNRLRDRGYIRRCNLDPGWFLTDQGRAAAP